jgi:lysophospholipase L1-like esterase
MVKNRLAGIETNSLPHDMKTPRPLASAALLFVATAATLFAHSANEAAPRTDQGWKDRQELLNKRVTENAGKAKVIFIGDSITQGWETDGKEIWAKYYAARDAVNLGIGGDRTQHVLYRLDNGNLNGLKPKAAVVMIGTNNSGGEDNTPEQIVEGVRAIVDKLRTKLPQTKILLLAIFPRAENFSVPRGKLAQINQVLRRVADEQSVFWIDFGHRFLNDDGTMPRELMPDYLHLSARGYAIWADAIEAELSSILGDTPVKAEGPGEGLTGEWILTIPGPNSEPIDIPGDLKQDGKTLTGRFARGPDRWLKIENGKVEDDSVSWIIKRDRENGGVMTYRMSGKLEGGKLKGKTETEVDGNPISNEWTAKRK